MIITKNTSKCEEKNSRVDFALLAAVEVHIMEQHVFVCLADGCLGANNEQMFTWNISSISTGRYV